MSDLRTMDYKTILRRVMYLHAMTEHRQDDPVITVADYTRFFGVHRNTARRHLKRFTDLGLLDEQKRYYRSNAHQYVYRIADKAHKHADFMLGALPQFPF